MYIFSKSIFFVFVASLLNTIPSSVTYSQDEPQATQYQKAIQKLHRLNVNSLQLKNIPYCLNYTCREETQISIRTSDWEEMTSVLNQDPGSARMERAYLAEIVSRFEVYSGRLANTQYDIAMTFKVNKAPSVHSTQLDCVDEAFNMYVLLNLLHNDGKLRWHSVGKLVHRGWLLDLSYPHTAMSIIEKDSLEVIVIDSWFHDNGRPPELVAYEKWKAGWTPLTAQ